MSGEEGTVGEGKKKPSDSGVKGEVKQETAFDKQEREVGREYSKDGTRTIDTRSQSSEKTDVKKTVKLYKKEWGEPKQGDVASASAEGHTDTASGSASVGLLHYKAEAKSEVAIDWKKKELKAKVISLEAKGSLVHGEAKGEFNLGRWFHDLTSDPPLPQVPSISPSIGGGPLAARVTDLTSHGSPLAPGIGSPNVLIGGLPAWRALIDIHACPIVKGLVPDVGGVVLVGAPTVFINNMMACRMGDSVVETPGGPNVIVLGCPTVMIGSAGSGVGGDGVASGGAGAASTGTKLTGGAKGDIGVIEAEAALEANFDLKKKVGVTAKAGGLVAVAKGSVEGGLTIPLWGSHSITFGGTAEGSLLSAGASAEASANWTPEKGGTIKLGAKVGAGLGVGLGFSLNVK